MGGYLPAPRAPLEEPARGLAGRQGWAVAFWCFLCSRRCATWQMDLVLQHHRSSPGTLRTASRSVLRVGPNDANSSVLGPSAGVLGTTSPGSSGVISSLAKCRGWTQRSFYLCRKREEFTSRRGAKGGRRVSTLSPESPPGALLPLSRSCPHPPQGLRFSPGEPGAQN